MTPTKIGRYEIKAELGRGGMATVYRAYDPSFDREVAIKVLPREFLHDPQFHDRFKREIKTIAALEHPAIVPVYDVGEDDGVPYFVMRYMTGGSLSSQIQRGKFSMRDAARIIERLASALAYAHKKGIVHRDLKPDNILFDNTGDPFISDFGVARFGTPATNLTGSGIIGTPAYMSPEQAQGEKVDNRSDIYGLGVIIFQMLSGKQPYNADTPMGVAIKHVTDPVPEILKVNPGLPEATDAIIKTAMAKNKDDRYASATELSHAFNQAAHGNRETVSTPARGRGSSGGKRGAIFGGLTLLAIILAGAFFFRDPIFAMIQPPPTLTATATATEPLPAPTVLPTGTPVPSLTATIVPFAAFCQPDTLQVPAPAVRETNKGCIEKVPYTTVSIPLGATFISLSPDMTCAIARTQVNDVLLTCTSKQSFFYQLKVCNPAPVISASSAGRCADSDSFDQANQCCLKPQAADAGCTVFQVDMKTCAE